MKPLRDPHGRRHVVIGHVEIRYGEVGHVEIGRGEVGRWHATSGALTADPTATRSTCDGAMARELWLSVRPGWAQAGWWDAELRPEVRALMWIPVGAALMRALVSARSSCSFSHVRPDPEEPIQTAGYPCACQVVLTAAWVSVASWAATRADGSLLDSVGSAPRTVPVSPHRPELGTLTDAAVEELAPALRSSPSSAHGRVAHARTLFSLPALRGAVTDGRILDWHARLLLSDLRNVSSEVRDAVIARLLAELGDRRRRGFAEWTFTELRRRARIITSRLDRDFTQRRNACHTGRRVRVRYHGDGASTVAADLPDDTAARVFHRISALAQGLDNPGDPRTMDQKRADVFLDLILGQDYRGEIIPPVGAPADPGRRGGPPPTPGEPTVAPAGDIAIVIDLETLVGLSEEPALIPGVGPIPATVARSLAADRTWRAWVTRTRRSTTEVVATSPGTYRPPAALARLLRAREPHCRMPGCRSMVTDLAHIVPFPRGATTAENLQPLCRRHHRMKTHTRWRVQSDEEDSWIWTSPNGVTFRDVAESPLP